MENPADALKDTMWYFLQTGSQKANVPALKEYVYDLIKATTQKDAGQRGHADRIDWNHLDMIMMNIVCEATALVLSGKLDDLEDEDDNKD